MSLFDSVRHISARDAADRVGLPVVLRGGKAWMACPLHGEKTPSLRLFEEAERGWYCFGCHAGGDAVALYAGLYRLEPLEAAKALAAAFGIDQTGPPPKPAPTVFNLCRALEKWRADRLVKFRQARALADGVCKCRVAIGGPEAWDDPAFIRALMARAQADIWIDRLEGAPTETLAAWFNEGKFG